MHRRLLSEDSGFTIIEVVIAVGILLVALLSTVAMIDIANAMTVKNKTREAALGLTREINEATRTIPYSEVTQAKVLDDLQARPGLEDDRPGTAGWQIERRDRIYTVTVTVCSVDDPNDGRGAHDSSFCASQAAGTADPQPTDYQRVRLEAEWSLPGTPPQRVEQTTNVASRGSADDPGVSSLVGAPGTPLLTVPSPNRVNLTAMTNMVAHHVEWSVDGAVQGQATQQGSSGQEWRFYWDLTTVTDGTYQVRADSYDSSNQAGAFKTVTYRLNRFVPSAPLGLAAGWNASGTGGRRVEVLWRLNTERDIVGYRVKRQRFLANGTAQAVETVCGASTPLGSTVDTCTNSSAPDATLYPRVDYWVVALDEDSTGTLRESVPSEKIDAYRANQPPQPPTGLTAQRTAEGTMLLNWTAPGAPQDPDAGDGIAFYRIYRDGMTPNPDRTGLGTDTSFEDPDPPAGPGTVYRVYSVDERLRQSDTYLEVAAP